MRAQFSKIQKKTNSGLKVELWTKIICYLDRIPYQLFNIQKVCQLFWNIIQEEFVAKGKLKSDLFDIRRPFSDSVQDYENKGG